jgi:hypothetical protein
MPSCSVPSERANFQMAAYSEYMKWGMYVMAVLGAWRYMPLTVVRLVAALTRSETRHRQCMEVLRLSRRDAATLPSYLGESPPERRPHRQRSRRREARASMQDGTQLSRTVSTGRSDEGARRQTRADDNTSRQQPGRTPTHSTTHARPLRPGLASATGPKK